MKNNLRKTYVSIGVILSLMALITVFTFRQEAQTNKSNQAKQEQDDPPTPIQLGVMSEKQRKHSKLFQKSRGEKDLVAQNRDINFQWDVPWTVLGTEATLFQFFDKQKCKSEMTIIGEVLSKESQLTDGNASVFTDYQIGIQEIIRNRQNLQLNPSSIITLTVRGGAVKVNNHIIRIKDRGFKPLHIGRKYLLFIKSVLDSETFIPFDTKSTFELKNGEAIPLTDEEFNHSKNYDLGETINQLKSSPICSGQGGN